MSRFLCASALLICWIQVSIAGTNETDKQALLDIKALIQDPLGVLSSWNDSLPVCKWYGVQCGLKHARVTSLNLDSSKLSGTISPSIGNLSFLSVLDLQNNSFGGTIPPEIGGLYRLQYISLNYNSLVGELPSNISRCSQLGEIHVYSNTLVGQIPPELGSLPYLYTLVLAVNNFTGTIPATLGNLSFLSTLRIKQNNLGGSIPTSLGKLRNLVIFDLFTNNLIGQVPPAIFNLSYLQIFTLGSNHLEGHLPSDLGNMLPNLQYFDISLNNFAGSIPSSISNHSHLFILDVSNNRLTGPLSDEVKGLVNLAVLDVSDNLLSGEVPAILGACVWLEELYMEGNLFQGVIPLTLTFLQSLQILDLSRNNLSGNIPESLQDLPLEMLNLSYNNLEGEVPISGVFSSATSVSLVGNGRLCGGLPQLKLDHCVLSADIRSRRIHRRNHIKMALVFGISGFLLLVAVVSLYTVYNRKQTMSATGASDLEKALPNLSYQMLHRATNGFSAENLIGRGASGVVYKGTLEDVGIVIAVKIFNLKHRGAYKSFVTECKALRNIRHKNLIKVITACSSLDYKGNDFKAIVYEYMANGSLDDWLHPREEIHGDKLDTASRHLNLRQRLQIAIDVAFALEYLHHDCGSSMIHCDLKPSNVLLDKDMMAHVADFGLAKFLSQAIINSSHSQSSSTGVRWTIGYVPPEYGMGNEVSRGGDIYSFGILVLETFTGKRPTDASFKEGGNLRDYVKSGLAKQDIRIADQALLRDMATEDSDSQLVFEVVISVFEIALTCCTELPYERPDMSDIVAKLSSIRTKLQGIHIQK